MKNQGIRAPLPVGALAARTWARRGATSIYRAAAAPALSCAAVGAARGWVAQAAAEGII